MSVVFNAIIDQYSSSPESVQSNETTDRGSTHSFSSGDLMEPEDLMELEHTVDDGYSLYMLDLFHTYYSQLSCFVGYSLKYNGG